MAVKEGQIQNQRKTWLKAQAGPDEAGYLDLEVDRGFPPLQMFGQMTTGMHTKRI